MKPHQKSKPSQTPPEAAAPPRYGPLLRAAAWTGGIVVAATATWLTGLLSSIVPAPSTVACVVKDTFSRNASDDEFAVLLMPLRQDKDGSVFRTLQEVVRAKTGLTVIPTNCDSPFPDHGSGLDVDRKSKEVVASRMKSRNADVAVWGIVRPDQQTVQLYSLSRFSPDFSALTVQPSVSELPVSAIAQFVVGGDLQRTTFAYLRSFVAPSPEIREDSRSLSRFASKTQALIYSGSKELASGWLDQFTHCAGDAATGQAAHLESELTQNKALARSSIEYFERAFSRCQIDPLKHDDNSTDEASYWIRIYVDSLRNAVQQVGEAALVDRLVAVAEYRYTHKHGGTGQRDELLRAQALGVGYLERHNLSKDKNDAVLAERRLSEAVGLLVSAGARTREAEPNRNVMALEDYESYRQLQRVKALIAKAP